MGRLKGPVSPARSNLGVLVVGSQSLFRDAVASLLEKDFTVVGLCSTTVEALEAIETVLVDVVLLDAGLGMEGCVDFCLRAWASGFAGHVLLLASAGEAFEAVLVAELGASGVFRKEDSGTELTKAIQTVGRGERWSPGETDSSPPPPRPPGRTSGPMLTAREREILQAIMEGMPNKKVALRLGIAESTVKSVVRRLFRKLEAHTRAQLVRKAMQIAQPLRSVSAAAK